MRKLTALLAALMLTAFGATSANAQICLSFAPGGFCDGLTLQAVGGGVVSGTWENYDCGGSEATIVGVVFGGQPGAVFVNCIPGVCELADVIGQGIFGPALFPIATFTIYFDDGTFLNSTLFDVSPGVCPFGPNERSTPFISAR